MEQVKVIRKLDYLIKISSFVLFDVCSEKKKHFLEVTNAASFENQNG